MSTPTCSWKAGTHHCDNPARWTVTVSFIDVVMGAYACNLDRFAVADQIGYDKDPQGYTIQKLREPA